MWALDRLDDLVPAEVVIGIILRHRAISVERGNDIVLLLLSQEEGITRRARKEEERDRSEAHGEQTLLLTQQLLEPEKALLR